MPRQAERIALVGLSANILLVAGKLAAGVLGHSSALIADAANSGSDVVAGMIVLFGIRIAKRPKDKTHPYGHGRIESIVAGVVGLMMLVAVGIIIREAIEKLSLKDTAAPSLVALITALFCAMAKETLFRVTIRIGRRLNSPAVVASAWDHRADVYSSIGVAAGIGGAMLGFPKLDPIAALVVAMFIFKSAVEVLKDSLHELTDRALPEAVIDRIKEVLSDFDEVLDITEVKGRKMGSDVLVDVGVLVSGFLSAKEAHDVAHRIEERLICEIPHLVEAMVHIDVEDVLSTATANDFKMRTQEILKEHHDMFKEIHELDYHFTEEGREIHFHLVVPEGMTFEEAHSVSKHLEDEIRSEFPGATAVIHMEPELESLDNREKK